MAQPPQQQATRQSPFRAAPTLTLAKAPEGHVQPVHMRAGFAASPITPSPNVTAAMRDMAPLPPMPPAQQPQQLGGAGAAPPARPAGTELRRALSGQGRQLLAAGLRKPLSVSQVLGPPTGAPGGAPSSAPPPPQQPPQPPPPQPQQQRGGAMAGGGGAGGVRPPLKPSLNVHTAHASKISSGATPRAGTGGNSSPLSDRLEEFYGRVKPEKQQDVAKIAAAYQGKEDELNFRLHREYAQSLEPNSPLYMPLKIHLERFYTKFNPSKMTEVETIATFYKDKLGELNEKLRAQYGEDLHSQMV